ncbi:MAG TPA: radical SAM protein [Desulfonatronum sp.]|nr:radical SAM protein [Desulfonatronum sp.]
MAAFLRTVPSPRNRPRILGINPWIYDFAAFNLWSRPVGLLACLSMLRRAGASVDLLDCLEPADESGFWPSTRNNGTGRYPKTLIPKPNALRFIPRNFGRYGLPPAHVESVLKRFASPPDAVLLSCVMTYWYPGITAMIRLVRRIWPRTPIILGGIYATLCPDHAQGQEADLVLPGPLELADNWKSFWRFLGCEPPLLPRNAGFELALDLYARPDFSVLLGSRGCPFACPYCASKQLFTGYWHQSAFDLAQALAKESARGVRNFAFYDDALLVDAKDWLIPFMEKLSRNNVSFRFHTPNAVHIRYLTPALCQLMRRAGFQTIRLGLETSAFEARLDEKLNVEHWVAALEALFATGFTAEQIGAYVLFGLPDQDMDEVRETIRFVRSSGLRPHLAFYSPIPGSALFSRACETSSYPLKDEPLFHNPSLWPCVPGGFSWQARDQWRRLTC